MTTDQELTQKRCIPCSEGTKPMGKEEQEKLLARVTGWKTVEGKKITKTFHFPNFSSAVVLLNKIAAIAEQENHHPNLHLSWGKLKVELWTHKLDGISENDFILAAKIDRLASG